MEIDVLVSETMCLKEAKARCPVSGGPNERICDPPRPTGQTHDLLRNLAEGSYPRSLWALGQCARLRKWTRAGKGTQGRRHRQDVVAARISLAEVVQEVVTLIVVESAHGPGPSLEPGVTGEATPSRELSF
jgi:hypothetical protein